MTVEFEVSTASLPVRISDSADYIFRRPIMDMWQEESRQKYLTHCLPLYKFALKGDWAAAKPLLDGNEMLLKAAIAEGWLTVLHVAVGGNHVHFVKELLNFMHFEDLELQDCKGNTAFCFAAANGNIPMAEIMLHKNPALIKIRGGDGMTPLHFAALQGKSQMAWYLYHMTVEIFGDRDWDVLFFTCINNGIDDLALKILQERPWQALARDENDETALHILARNPSSFGCQIADQHKNSGMIMKETTVLQIVELILECILGSQDSKSEIRNIVSTPSHILIDAAEAGNFVFLAKLLSFFPDLLWEVDTRNRSIIHIAVLHRHSEIYNLIHTISSNKDMLVTYVDPEDGNNLLHLAAKLAPVNQLELTSGAAFQMRAELLRFEEVKNILPPSYVNMKNLKGMSPQELFNQEHKELLKESQKWMKETTSNCLVVSVVLTIVVFSAAFNLPGGANDNSRNPNYLGKTPSLIFSIANAIAMISSSISVLIFLSILSSCCAKYDFYKSLSSKLIFGMVALFISITTMMISFITAIFMSCYHGTKWVTISIAAIAALPTLICLFAVFPLI